jgi:hypothetical protein
MYSNQVLKINFADFCKMLSRALGTTCRLANRGRSQVRYSSGIKLLNERAKAEEDYYFSKQDGMYSLCAYE